MVWEKQVECCGHINLGTRFSGLAALDHGIERKSSHTSISEELKGGEGFWEFSDAKAGSGIILGGMLKFLIFVLGFGTL